ncbi:MAG: integrase [Burkholderiales bacterium PBB5]|nr:MAG: integrase [Burkholderiales bacterium PBB5]
MGLGVAHRSNSAQAGESLTTARKLARDARDLVQRGSDPIDERDRQRGAAREAEQAQKVEKARERATLARAARDYHERVIEPSRTSKHAAQWISSLENHVPAAVWHKPIADVTAPELLAALGTVRPHERARNISSEKVPETLQRLRQRLDAVFEDAIFHGLCTTNPAAAIRRKMREAQDTRQRGEFAALPYREAPAFLAQLREAEGIAARCLEFAVLTAARTGEVLGATWVEIDLDAALWTVPAARMKAKEAHAVALPPRAVEILRSLAALKLDAALVFPSPMLNGKPLSNMAMLTLLGRMGMRDRTTVHGLCRATFSTWANETGAARPDVIEACLAHEESNKVRASYNRAQFHAERRALLEAWAEYLSKPPASNVVALKVA